MRLLLKALITLMLIGCNGRAEFKARRFSVGKEKILSAIDSVYGLYPQYKMPDKWIVYDGYSERGHKYENEWKFYFSPPPEEMISVSIVSRGEESKLIISSVHDETGWHHENDMARSDIMRVQKRFDERIIPKLEKFAKTACIKD
jgi:hypothetical protein